MKGAPDSFHLLTFPFQPVLQGCSPLRNALRETSTYKDEAG